MPHLHLPSRRLAAGALAAALPVTLLAAAPARASDAATDDPTLTWKVSQQFVDHFAKKPFNQNTFEATGGASLTPGGETVFGAGDGWVDPRTGDASLRYTGTITGSFVVGAPQYSIALSDPTIKITDGKGQITADVAWTVPSDTGNPSGSTDDVLVTTFDAAASDWSAGALSATPDWSNQSFAPQFMAALNPGLQAHFRASGSSSDAKKSPAPFTATAAAPSATATITQATRSGVSVRVQGRGYTPGGVGIYVGITEAGPVNSADATKYLGTIWLPGSQIGSDGSFDRTVELAPDDLARLDPAKTYEVHTQKAHGQSASDPSQNVRLPLALDIPSLQGITTTASATPVTTSYSAKGAKVTVRVPGATGKVELTLAGTTKTLWVKDGAARFAVPSTLPAKIYTAKASYLGNATYAPSSASTKVTVRSTPTTTGATVPTVPQSTKTGKISIAVTNTATKSSPTPKGTATVTLTRAGTKVTLTRTLQYGKVTATLPRLAKGTWTANVAYSGEAGKFVKSSKKVSVKVTR